jgi:hypothetical protein
VALKALTVSFDEYGFIGKLNSENQFGPWFTLSDREKQQLGNPMGPSNPQALNRYSYVQNNPVKYTDPSGHCVSCVPVIQCMLDAKCRERVWQNVTNFVKQAAVVLYQVLGGDVAWYGDKIAKQMPKRGWTDADIENVLNNPADTAKSVNKATGNTATRYYGSDGHYVVRDDITGEIIQVSDRLDLGWIDDLTHQPVYPRNQ